MARSDFVGLERVVHLAAGGESPMLRASLDAIQRFAGDKAMGYVGGYSGRRHIYETYGACKTAVGRLAGCGPGQVALLGSASDGISTVAAGLRFAPGDNMVTVAREFPSVSAPWLPLTRRGLQIREAEPDPARPLAAVIREACDRRTRIIAVSQVSFLTGERVDVAALRAVADECGALLLVDASHALGVLPVDAGLSDFLVSSCYKFMLATHGVGIFTWRSERLDALEPDRLGWHSVHTFPPVDGKLDLKPDGGRFEAGNPSFIGVYVLETAVNYLLRRPATELEKHVLGLGSRVLAGLTAMGVESTTPAAPERRGPNVCIAHPQADELTAALRLEGVYVWAGAGRIRISLHGFNDETDVDRVLAGLKRLLRR